MRLPKHTRNHPLGFLLHLEWMLLLVVALGEIPPFLIYQLPRVVWLNWLGLGLLTLSGLWLPNRLLHRILHLSLDLGLILGMSLIGSIRIFPVLFIVLVIRSSFSFKPRTCLVITAISLTLCVLVQTYRFQFLTLSPALANPDWLKRVWLGSILLAGLTLVFLQLLVYTVLSERQSREQLMIAHAKLQQYALEIENLATVQERNRIAREIHDALGHSLTAFNLHLDAALRLLNSDPDEARTLLVEAKQLGSTALHEVRRAVKALRTDPLGGNTLEAAVPILIEDFHRTTGVLPTCRIGIDRPLSLPIKLAAYRIVQEALTNICKYANATCVQISLQTLGELEIVIEDNGKGFDPNLNTTGFGLQGMRERTVALSGNFELHTAPDAGCRIVVTLPLPSTP